jgi:hypothetical protein
MFVAAADGTITKQVTGLAWRHAVSAQVFEEAAVDLGRALSAYAEAKAAKRKDRVGFPAQTQRTLSGQLPTAQQAGQGWPLLHSDR